MNNQNIVEIESTISLIRIRATKMKRMAIVCFVAAIVCVIATLSISFWSFDRSKSHDNPMSFLQNS